MRLVVNSVTLLSAVSKMCDSIAFCECVLQFVTDLPFDITFLITFNLFVNGYNNFHLFMIFLLTLVAKSSLS